MAIKAVVVDESSTHHPHLGSEPGECRLTFERQCFQLSEGNAPPRFDLAQEVCDTSAVYFACLFRAPKAAQLTPIEPS
jgi:hypothetical protein